MELAKRIIHVQRFMQLRHPHLRLLLVAYVSIRRYY
jgi:hypothetical protein